MKPVDYVQRALRSGRPTDADAAPKFIALAARISPCLALYEPTAIKRHVTGAPSPEP